MSTTSEIPQFPMPRTCPYQPPPRFAELRSSKPVSKVRLWNGSEAWLVTSHQGVKQVLSGPEFSANDRLPGYPGVTPAMSNVLEPQVFLRLDPPDHSTQRRMMTKYFTATNVERFAPFIQAVTDQLLDQMIGAGTTGELVADFADQLPAMLICHILGVPLEEKERFQRHAEVLFGDTATAEESASSLAAMKVFLEALIDERVAAPRDDLISILVREHYLEGHISKRDLAGVLELLLNAGHDTTANMIALGFLTLLDHPEQLAMVRADPDLVPGTVEELLRYLAPVDLVATRVAIADVVVEGTLIRAGEGVIPMMNAANRDASVFVDADAFDPKRRARGHVAFGFGVHQCLGQNLARLELRIVFETMLRRLPGLRLTVPVSDIAMKDGFAIFGIRSLPVAWDIDPARAQHR